MHRSFSFFFLLRLLSSKNFNNLFLPRRMNTHFSAALRQSSQNATAMPVRMGTTFATPERRLRLPNDDRDVQSDSQNSKIAIWTYHIHATLMTTRSCYASSLTKPFHSCFLPLSLCPFVAWFHLVSKPLRVHVTIEFRKSIADSISPASTDETAFRKNFSQQDNRRYCSAFSLSQSSNQCFANHTSLPIL